MGSSKDADGGENAGLTVVSISSSTNAPSTSDKLAELRSEHRTLDEEIQSLISSGSIDQLQLTRYKKRKLMLRDLITRLEGEIVPDIIA